MQYIQISVIMGVHGQNYCEKLELAVRSVLAQSLKEFEFLIFNDGSGPGMTAQLERLALSDCRIRLLKSEQRKGLAFGLNQCIRQAKGEYLARMDGDDYSLPQRFEKQIQFLKTHPSYDFTGCAAVLLDQGRRKGLRKMPRMPEKKDFLAFSPYIHPSVMFRRTVFERGGLYSEKKEHFRCEDYELFMRLYQKGFRGFNMQEPLFLYREEKESMKKRTVRSRIEETRLRHTSFRDLGLTGPKHVLAVLRPLAGGLIPDGLIWKMKQKEAQRNERKQQNEWQRKGRTGKNSTNGACPGSL